MRPTRALRRFARDGRGTLTVEAVLVLPALLIAFASCFILFDYFKTHTLSQKAAFTLGDLLSRETEPITPAYMDGAHELLKVLAGRSASKTSLRVTMIRYDARRDRYVKVWSQVRGSDLAPLTRKQVRQMASQLPVMVDQEEVILVDTVIDYKPLLDLGVTPDLIQARVFTRPRFAPQLPWQGV